MNHMDDLNINSVDDFFHTNDNSIKINIDQQAHRKMKYWIEAAKGEVSGLLFVKEQSKGVYLVMDAVILKQKCSGAYTDLDKKAMLDFIVKCHKKGIDTREVMRGWWHSHATFGVFWSGTDTATAARFGFDGADAPDWWVSVVANKAGDILGRVDTYKPTHRCLNDDITPRVTVEEDEKLRKKCFREVKELVTEIRYRRSKKDIQVVYTHEETVKYDGILTSQNEKGGLNAPEYLERHRTGLNEFTIGHTKYEWTGQGLLQTGRIIQPEPDKPIDNRNRSWFSRFIHNPLSR